MTDPGAGRPPVVEITDLIPGYDLAADASVTLQRADIIARLEASGQQRAAKIVAGLAHDGDCLDSAATEALVLRVHCELQRLGEELQLARRIADALAGWVRDLRAVRPDAPVRIVDVGCGIGYVVRWLAAHQSFDDGVELIGVDLNAALVGEAERLAAIEGLRCRFHAGDALQPGTAVLDGTRTIVVSSGLLHHLTSAELTEFFAAQQRLGVTAFAHWDIDPSPWSTLGAWVFHRTRMREAVSRHDGVLSVRRAHTATSLLAAARSGAGNYEISCVDAPRWRPRFTNVLRPITGLADGITSP